MREEMENQAGKITFVHVTQGGRPKLEVSQIHSRIQYGFWTFWLSKNAVFNKNHLIIVPVTRSNHALPTG
jgi:hypothetical protein